MTLSTNIFNYDKDTRTFSAWGSDGPLYSSFLPGKKVPEVIGLESARTGVVINVEYLSKRVEHGELVSWTYYNHDNNISIVIFND